MLNTAAVAPTARLNPALLFTIAEDDETEIVEPEEELEEDDEDFEDEEETDDEDDK